MFNRLRKKLFILTLGILFIFPFISSAENEIVSEPVNNSTSEEKVDIYLFERDGCGFCAKEVTFFEYLITQRDDFNLIIVDIGEAGNRQQFDLVTDKYNLPKVTPTTVVGEFVFQGFGSFETTGQDIINFIEQSKTGVIIDSKKNFDFNVPFFGT